MSTQMKYQHMLTEVVIANVIYHSQYKTSPTIAQLSEMIGATEEHILESMEFGHSEPGILC